MEKLIGALLNDENGICEEAYNALVEYLEKTNKQKLLAWVKRADATDGRFYFPSES